MPRWLQLTLDSTDACQLLDGLATRAEQWEATAEILETGYVTDDRYCVLECESPEEAVNIGRHYRELIANLERQIATQTA